MRRMITTESIDIIGKTLLLELTTEEERTIKSLDQIKQMIQSKFPTFNINDITHIHYTINTIDTFNNGKITTKGKIYQLEDESKKHTFIQVDGYINATQHLIDGWEEMSTDVYKLTRHVIDTQYGSVRVSQPYQLKITIN